MPVSYTHLDVYKRQGMQYVERGWITQDEYENLHDYLFIPYSEAGGNGSAAKVMKDVDNLPIHKTGYKRKEV